MNWKLLAQGKGFQEQNWRDVAVTESVQWCFELSIHFPVFFPRTIFSSSSRLVRYTDKCMESSKHD